MDVRIVFDCSLPRYVSHRTCNVCVYSFLQRGIVAVWLSTPARGHCLDVLTDRLPGYASLDPVCLPYCTTPHLFA